MRGEEPEGEAADGRSLPDDVGDVDLRLASSGIARDDKRAAEGEGGQGLTGQRSANAVHDDIYALAVGDTQDTVLEALLGEVDDMFISSRTGAFGFSSVARGGDDQ